MVIPCRQPGQRDKQSGLPPLLQRLLVALLLSLPALRSANALQSLPLEIVKKDFKAFCILQDRLGFMWFGSLSGLYRYDGYMFNAFRHDAVDTTTLSDDQVNALAEDGTGNLWVGTRVGLDRLNPFTGRVTRFVLDRSMATERAGTFVTSLLVDREGTLWIGTQEQGVLEAMMRNTRGEDTLVIRRHTWRPDDSSSLSNPHVHALCDDSRSHGQYLFVATSHGLNRLDKRTGRSVRFFHEPGNQESMSHNEVWNISEDSSGDIWLGVGNGVCRMVRRQDGSTIFRSVPLDLRDPVFNICHSHDGSIWITTHASEIIRLDSAGRQAGRHSLTWTINGRLMPDPVLSTLCDRQGTLWIGSSYHLWRVDPMRKSFHFVPIAPPRRQWQMAITDFVEDRQGDLWIATTSRGLLRARAASRDTINYAHVPGDPRSLCWNEVQRILQDQTGSLWIGTTNGLDQYDPRTDSFKHFRRDSRNAENIRGLSGNCVYEIYEDHAGDLWIATNGGLSRLDRGTMRFQHYLHKGEMLDLGFYIGAVCQPRTWTDGSLLLGSRGLYKFRPADGSLARYEHVSDLPGSHVDHMIHTLYEDATANIWVGTFAGLFMLGANGTFRDFREEQSLPTSLVSQIIEDRDGFLWVGTADKGLVKYDPTGGTLRTYEVKEGFLTNEFPVSSPCRSKDGTLYFGRGNGLTRFNPQSVRDNTFVPPIRITGMRIFDRPHVPERGFDESDGITLSHTETMLVIEFIALSFTDAEENQYAYRMEGLSDEWFFCKSQRTATFTNLDPGEYVFHVKGSNCDGLWNEAGTSLRIVITPPWWRTAWAYGLYGVILMSALYGVHRTRLNRQRLRHQLQIEQLEAQKLKEVDQVKSRFFSNVSHEFRTPLTLIIGPAEKLRASLSDPRSLEDANLIYRNAKKLHGLINQLLDFARVEAGSMKLAVSSGDIVVFVNRAVQSYQSWAERKRIGLTFECDQDFFRGFFDRDKVEKILNNLVSNALKFTQEGGRVTVSLSNLQSGGHRPAELAVCDTGIGISAEHLPHIFDRFYRIDESHKTEGTGIGLALTRELVELHHGTISVKSETAKGSEFIVRIPLHREAYSDDEIAESRVGTETEGELGRFVSAAESVPSLPAELPCPGERPIILVVEDNADVRAYVRGYLEAEYAVLEAEDGAKGLAKSIETIPDLVVSDVMMPAMDGYELCRALKQDERTSHIPVILLTARAATESKIEGLATGADDYLTKPFEAPELLARISNLIEGRRLLREKWSKTVALRPGEVAVTSLDDPFLRRVMASVQTNMGKASYGVDELAHDACLSRSQLHRKLVALTNLPPAEFTRRMRLLRARDMLDKNAGTVAEVAEYVGFSDASYFAHAFQKEFGVLPSEVRRTGSIPSRA
ncbi:MAG: two-component regulator propeller domain-containing protein [Bacteroidota bacterium]